MTMYRQYIESSRRRRGTGMLISAALMLVVARGLTSETAALAAQVPPTLTPGMVAQATPSSPLCRDSYEDDGVPSQAKPLVIGEVQTHTFCPARDADWVTFFAKSGKGYSMETSNLAVGVDTYLNMFAPDGTTLLATNDDAPGGSVAKGESSQAGASRLLFFPQTDGWYFVQAKNQGDIGYAGLKYSLSLRQIDLPTATPTATLQASSPTPSATLTPAIFVADLLHPAKSDGGVDVYVAGSSDAMRPDALEPDDMRDGARPVNIGAVYKYLNFVPQQGGSVDADYYSFRAKPGLCYLVQTGDLSAGLDTTLLLWLSPAGTKSDSWKLAAQNDDAHPGSPNLGSAVRWCAHVDASAVVEVRNYGGAVTTDPRGKSYSLSVTVDPPTPTPTRTPANSPPVAIVAAPAPDAPQRVVQSGSGGSGGPGARQGEALRQAPTSPPVPPTATPAVAATATPIPTGTAIQPTATLAPSATATPALPSVSVDLVAYVGDQSSTGPNPGDGIVGLPVLLVDVRTNANIQSATTDQNGHAQLSWKWQGPVRVAIPAFRWGKTLELRNFISAPAGAGDVVQAGGSLMLQARMSSYPLPGILP